MLISGAAALTHQIIWVRRFIDLLGADANTFAQVVGAFFAGLASGAALAPRFLPRARRWLRVAWAEALVAILALPPLFSYGLGEKLLALLPWKGLLPILLITPPAAAMGLVLPVLLAALSPSLPPRSTLHLYGLNTLGGVIGVLGTLLVLLPQVGITQAGLIAIALNLTVAIAAATFSPSSLNPDQISRVKGENATSLSFRQLLIIAFASGYAILSSEVILQQQLAQVTINSIFSSGFVLATVLAALGLAALILPLLPGSQWVLPTILGGSALLCFLQPFQLIALRPNLEMLPYELPTVQYSLAMLKLAALTVCPLILVAGLLFPFALHSQRPRKIALLLASNGVGGWLGQEFTHTLVLPRLGLWVSMALVGVVYLALLAVIRARWLPLFGIAVLAVCLPELRQFPQVSIHEREQLARLRVGREGVVATVQAGQDDWRMLFNNSYTLGGSKAQFNQERQAHLPLLLHGNPQTVACLGVATGSTVAGAALHPNVQHIDAIELSPLVLAQAKAFFSPFNREVFANPRVRFIQDDARWVVASRSAAYDVVVGDLFLPWRTGEGRLFTLQHFENVRASLKPDGIFCQWLPMFQLTRPQFEIIARTFQKVFPDTWLLRGDFYTELPILGLLGGRNLAQLDWEQVGTACQQLRSNEAVTDPLVRHAAGLAMMIIGPLPDASAGPVNTLANNWLEWDAGRNIIGLKAPWFIGVPCAEYIRGIHRAAQAAMPAELREAHDAGQFFLTLEIAAKLQLPALADLKSQIPSRIPPSLWQDPAASWQTWPMRIKPAPIR